MLKKKLILSLTLASILCLTPTASVLAAEIGEPIMTQEELENATVADPPADESQNSPMPRTQNSKSYTIPGGKGTLTSNAWRSTVASSPGNTYQRDYQVSAVYSGNYAVSSIRTTWKGSASLRNSASIDLGISDSGASAGGGSSWQKVNTVTKYWENTNGAKESSYRSNMVVSPQKDYRSNTIAITNTARVKLSKDAKPYEITASC